MNLKRGLGRLRIALTFLSIGRWAAVVGFDEGTRSEFWRAVSGPPYDTVAEIAVCGPLTLVFPSDSNTEKMADDLIAFRSKTEECRLGLRNAFDIYDQRPVVVSALAEAAQQVNERPRVSSRATFLMAVLLIPPIALLMLGGLCIWIVEGFRSA